MATVFCVGQAVQDFVFTLPSLPQSARKYPASRFEPVGGGPAATAATAIARLGGRPLLAARVGADAVADAIIAELERYGVDCRAVRRMPGCQSSLSAVMIDAAGERMIVNYVDPAMPASPDWIPDAGESGASVVLADCRWPEGAERALGMARDRGLPAVLDADRPRLPAAALLRLASHVAFSAEALQDLTGMDDPAQGLRNVAAQVDGWSCVTAGAAGVYAMTGGEVRHFPGYRVPVVDTLGAGDVWHGAFALALAEGKQEADGIRFASAAAALKVQRPGGRPGVPLRNEVEEFLKTAATPAPRVLA